MDPTEDSNWVKARSSVVWIAALLVAFGAVWWIEQQTQMELIAKTGAPATAGSPLATLVAERQLGLVDQPAFDQRAAQALRALPAPRNPAEAEALLPALLLLAQRHPQHAEAARQAVARWNPATLASDAARLQSQALAAPAAR